MKHKMLIACCFHTVMSCNSFAQNDSSVNTMPFYWTYELGSSYLTSGTLVKNHSALSLPTASGSLYFNWNFPIGKNQSSYMSGFYIAPGLGLGAGTYSIDKDLSERDGALIIGDISGSYKYCYVQGIYLDMPIDLRYFIPTDSKFRKYYVELGGKFGKLLYTEKEIAISQGDDFFVHKTKNVGIMNPYRYSINAKAGVRKIKLNTQNDVFGFAFSLIVNYYFSNAFKFQEISPSQSVSIGAGLGLLFK